MKKTILGAMTFCFLLGGSIGCKKSDPQLKTTAQATKTDNSANESARMWTSGRQLYAVGTRGGSPNASLYKLATPPSFLPVWFADFFVGGTPVTYVTGIAYTTDAIIISTGPTSSFANKILIYSTIVPPFNTPTIVNCLGITDIEYNEYDGNLYGVRGNAQVVQINWTTGAVTVNLIPTIPSGCRITGLCNYNGLLTYCISDATSAPDTFYSYNPGSLVTFFSFTTDWGVGDGGMQYAGGWAIVTYNGLLKSVSGAGVSSAFSIIPGGPYFITDLTSS